MTAPTGLVPRPRQAPQLPKPGPGNHFASHDLVPAASAAEARRFTHDSLAAWAVTVDPSDAEIITSELVTNATQHAGPAADGRPAIILSLIASKAGLTISVWDNGPCDALCGQSSAASDDAEDGQGTPHHPRPHRGPVGMVGNPLQPRQGHLGAPHPVHLAPRPSRRTPGAGVTAAPAPAVVTVANEMRTRAALSQLVARRDAADAGWRAGRGRRAWRCWRERRRR